MAWVALAVLGQVACTSSGGTDDPMVQVDNGAPSQPPPPAPDDTAPQPASDAGAPSPEGALPETPAYPPGAPGPYAVGHLSTEAVDDARGGRTLPLEVWYPVDASGAGAYPRTQYPLFEPILSLESELAREEAPVAEASDLPLVVFSHGYGSVNIQSIPLMETLASHGFVVVAPEHIGNSQGASEDDFDTAASKRVPDAIFVVDHMQARSQEPGDAFHTRLGARVGLVGHSFGGMTALGTKVGWAGAEPDARVGAIVPISAVIDGDLQEDDRGGPNAGFTEEQLARADAPVLLVAGTEDVDVPAENNAIAFDQLINAPAVYRLDIVGANHTHFANVCTFGDTLIANGIVEATWPLIGAGELVEPYEQTCTDTAAPVEEVDRLLGLFTVAFLRYHLLDEPEYAPYLTSQFAGQEPMAELSIR